MLYMPDFSWTMSGLSGVVINDLVRPSTSGVWNTPFLFTRDDNFRCFGLLSGVANRYGASIVSGRSSVKIRESIRDLGFIDFGMD